jgi:hypothetical protein
VRYKFHPVIRVPFTAYGDGKVSGDDKLRFEVFEEEKEIARKVWIDDVPENETGGGVS